jgi:hypothetical protein
VLRARRMSRAVGFAATMSVVAVGVGTVAEAAASPSAVLAQAVSAVPGSGTPQISNGSVLAMAQVGGTLVAGGTFTQAQNYAKTTTYTRNHIIAFDAVSGAVNPAFAPNLNGEVDGLLAGPVAGTVYVAGKFTTDNGATVPGLVLLRVSDGSRVTTFAPAAMNKGVTTARLANGQLIIGGRFTKVGTVARGGLASLDPTTGALTGYLTAGVSGHHNYGHLSAAELAARPPWPIDPTPAKGDPGILQLAINAQGTRMVVIGDFDTAGGQPRDQIAAYTLSPTSGALNLSWATQRYSDACFWWSFDAYTHDVDFAPDGNSFEVATEGGKELLAPENTTLCDTVAKWDATAQGTALQPIWVQASGSDSFFGVADTGSVVYAVGHPRFGNNPNGSDFAGGGAVARPSLMALDPVNGMPLKWNPGREPRGHGMLSVLATPAGLWLGYDNNFMGNHAYTRGRIAFLPLAGGYVPASSSTPTLPAHVVLAAPAAAPGKALVSRTFNGTTPGADLTVTSPIDFSTVHGAVLIGGTLFYGKSDKMLYSRTFNGTAYGPEQQVNPYSDPLWDNVVDAGRGTNNATLKGAQPDFYAQLPTVSAMAFSSDTHRLYYTLAGDSNLYYRAFSPDSGVIYPIATAISGVSMAHTTGLVINGSSLWFADGSTGNLSRVGLGPSGYTGSPSVVNGPSTGGPSWAAGTLFTAP